MFATVKIIWFNLRNAKFHSECIWERDEAIAHRDKARWGLAHSRTKFKKLQHAHTAHFIALRAVVKRFGPNLWLPTRCLNEAQTLTLEMKKRDDSSTWLRVKGKGKDTH